MVENISINAISNPSNVKRVESIISESDWNHLFPLRDEKYTYLNFLKAIGKYPAFCGDYSDGRDAEAICRKSLATMFAHFTQETGGHDKSIADVTPEWRQGLYYLREIGWQEGTPGGYGVCGEETWQGRTYPCGTFPDGTYKSYFGRGSKQLSYNYNYGPFSQSIYGNVETLLNQPELVADTWLNLASAVFFYLYPQPPKPSMLHVIDGTWQPNQQDIANGLVPGFGVTTQIINGGVECGGASEHIQSQNRIDYYHNFANYLDVPVPQDEVLGCASMKQFDEGGAGALSIYWEEDWGWSSETPTGETYKCQLKAYQVPHSAFIEGDYRKCVEYHFDVTIIDDLEGVAPTANAGVDKTIFSDNTVVELDGSLSSSASTDTLTYEWVSQGELLPITNADKAVATVVIPKVDVTTEYPFTLTITNQDGESDSDDMVVTANTKPDNMPPIVTLSGESTAISGESMTVTAEIVDEDDTVFTIDWTNDSNLTLVIADDDRSVNFVAPEVEVETAVNITVTVTDSGNNIVSSAQTVTISPPDTGTYPNWILGHEYAAGDRVTANGVNYECKPWPYSAWCGSNVVYQPGVGTFWSEAWFVVE
ncbi:glycoside hydrolase family 19 protein [Enterovibrio coralii]|uniref:glycoside hydrolase family 19 protein n=1 Tax=Enterovibrio coralii TaxID=294935 RepID=UPI001E650B8C|nr:glycoside hydrolase family 19 protein [Enterovibrio coralii]